jgi:TfoX/Sxy family transcriptional regulator of competence genes
MNIPRASDASKTFFRSTLPKDPRITVRPVFGNESAFVNGNMFYGLFGDDLFVRLPDKDSQEILAKGGAMLEPMKGRPMKEYVILPRAWWKQPETIMKWIEKSLDWTAKMPEKKKLKK